MKNGDVRTFLSRFTWAYGEIVVMCEYKFQDFKLVSSTVRSKNRASVYISESISSLENVLQWPGISPKGHRIIRKGFCRPECHEYRRTLAMPAVHTRFVSSGCNICVNQCFGSCAQPILLPSVYHFEAELSHEEGEKIMGEDWANNLGKGTLDIRFFESTLTGYHACLFLPKMFLEIVVLATNRQFWRIHEENLTPFPSHTTPFSYEIPVMLHMLPLFSSVWGTGSKIFFL